MLVPSDMLSPWYPDSLKEGVSSEETNLASKRDQSLQVSWKIHPGLYCRFSTNLSILRWSKVEEAARASAFCQGRKGHQEGPLLYGQNL